MRRIDKPRGKCEVFDCAGQQRIMKKRVDGSYSYFKICSRHYREKYGMQENFIKKVRKWQTESELGLLSRIRARAKRKGIYFRIDGKNFKKWVKSQPLKCVYCSLPVDHFRKLTVDKVVPNEGYVLNNLALACRCCNMIKSNIFTFEEMKEIANKYNLRERYA